MKRAYLIPDLNNFVRSGLINLTIEKGNIIMGYIIIHANVFFFVYLKIIGLLIISVEFFITLSNSIPRDTQSRYFE